MEDVARLDSAICSRMDREYFLNMVKSKIWLLWGYHDTKEEIGIGKHKHIIYIKDTFDDEILFSSI